MIYFISKKKKIFKDYNITLSTIDHCLDYFKDKEFIGVDTETTGFDIYNSKLLLLQLGDEENQFVIDRTTIDIRVFKELLETKTIILHNAKFDLRFLYKHNIIPFGNVFDTFLAERVLSTGIDRHRKALDACVERYLKKTLSKDIRGLIFKLGPYDPRVIRYAADDVKYLIPLRLRQYNKLKQENLLNTISLDNLFVSVLAYVEYSGVYIDQDRWIEKSNKDLEHLKIAEEKLNKYLLELDHKPFLNQPDLFNSNWTPGINWNSTQQAAPVFKHIGLDISILDKKTKEYKDSLESKHIKKYKGNTLVDLYLKYKKFEKLVSNYGISFLDHINKHTNRIHTNFTQIRNTGRLASGSDKDGIDISRGVNLQNIPARNIYNKEEPALERLCFVAEPNNTLVVSDYSGQETRILAEFSKDKEFSSYISDKTKDLHSFMASLIYPELKQYTHKEIKENYSNKRQFAKAATFAIPYGGDGNTISINLNLPREQGIAIYDEFMRNFGGLDKYFKLAKHQVLRDGYVLINDVTGRKSYIDNFDLFKQLEKELTPDFWYNYNIHKKEQTEDYFEYYKPKVSKYFSWKSNIERTGMNYRIQGTAADMSKLAGIKLFKWILDNNYFDIVKMCIPVHDEWVVECPINIQEVVSHQLQKAMEDAGKVFCKNIPIYASPVISHYWTH
jgi:DNA polymerase I-like protein with 3'-5' exonuclease and polymerase domains